jgi:hypothetical protein
VGSRQPISNPRHSARGRHPRARTCFRHGCGRKFVPHRWNQRYCQDAECQKLLRRWQGARRQAKRRQDEQAKAQHAAAERARRERAKSSPEPAGNTDLRPARGHAAENFFRSRSATAPAAMNTRKPPSATLPSIAAANAAKPSATSWTANASGRPAARWKAERSVPSSIARLDGGGRRVRVGRRRNARLVPRPLRDRPLRRSSLIASPPRGG